MRSYLVVVLSLIAATAGAQTASLGWMSGCWVYQKGSVVVTEQWSAPRASMMLGSGHTTKGNATLEYEQTRIVDRDGKLVYQANPSGQAPAEFFADAVGDGSVVFSNPTHDFPQRVSYKRAGPDSLIARVEGTRGGQVRGVDFPYVRVACSPAEPKQPSAAPTN
jgi:hypothetical protein